MSLLFKNKKEVPLFDKRQVRISDFISAYRLYILDSIQRSLDEERVKSMIQQQNDHFSKHKCLFTIGEMVLIDEKNDGSYGILDGQHRFYCYNSVWKLQPDAIISICIIDKKKYNEELLSLFKQVNENIAVPEDIKVGDTKAKELRKYINEKYKEYLSKSSKPSKPNVNLDVLIHQLRNSSFYSEFKSYHDVIDYFEYANWYIEKLLPKELVEKEKQKKKLAQKRYDSHLFFGYDMRYSIDREDVYVAYRNK